MRFYIWDLETYVNCFLFTGEFLDSPVTQTFEISSRINQRNELLNWLSYLQNSQTVMVGYNSIGFDYPILHVLLNNPYTFDAMTAFQEAQKIIGSQQYGFTSISFKDRIFPQLDLMRIHHFDNPAKRTSLKALQFAMRSESVEDLPFDPSLNLTSEQMDQLRSYNIHDVTETERFLIKSMPLIKMRQDLLEQGVLSGDVLNYSDVKIGTEYLVKRIGRAKCYDGNKPKQTFRASVEFRDIILPKIYFRTEPFQQVLDWFNKQTVWIAAEERPKLEVKLAELQFHFGVGGLHASVENRYYESTETHVVRDIDVSGMYVAVVVANGFAPEHLGADFTGAYSQLKQDRSKFAKGSAMNLTLKLAGNGASGNFNNSFSPFFDPKCYYSMTVTGQLQLLQIVEAVSLIPGLQLIQANTDGITVIMPRSVSYLFDMWKAEWEKETSLKLEAAEYSRMWIADVNNYLAIDTEGNIKRKGRYWYPITDSDYQGSSGSNWNKDFSNLTAQKCAEAVMLNNWSPRDVLRLMTDPFDFMMRYKTPAGAQLFIGDKPMLKTVRYYVSTRGEKMVKKSKPKGEVGTWKRRNGITNEEYDKILKEIPPGAHDPRIHTKNKSKYAEVSTSVEAGRLVKECNKSINFDWSDVDYDYYEEEIKKLLIGERYV